MSQLVHLSPTSESVQNTFVAQLIVNHEVLKEYHRRGLGGLELGGGLTPRIDGVAEHCSPLFPWPLMAFHGFLGIFWVYKL